MAEKKTEAEVKKAVEEKYMMLQLMASQIRELEKELETLQQRGEEFSGLKASLRKLSGVSVGSKSFSSLGMGTYVESEIKNTGSILVNVGAGVFVKKTAREAEDIVSRQTEQLDTVAGQLTHNIATLAQRAQELESEIQELVQ